MTKTTKNTKTQLTTTMKSDKAITKNLTKAEIAKAQETAQDRQLAFVDAMKKQKCFNSVNAKNEVTIKTDSKATALVCRKEKFTAIYTCKCTDKAERDKVLATFKNTDYVHTCNSDKYLASKETRIQLIIEDNTVTSDYIKILVDSVDAIKKALVNSRKKTAK